MPYKSACTCKVLYLGFSLTESHSISYWFSFYTEIQAWQHTVHGPTFLAQIFDLALKKVSTLWPMYTKILIRGIDLLSFGDMRRQLASALNTLCALKQINLWTLIISSTDSITNETLVYEKNQESWNMGQLKKPISTRQRFKRWPPFRK